MAATAAVEGSGSGKYTVRGQSVGRQIGSTWVPCDGPAVWVDGLVLWGTRSIRFEIRPVLRGEYVLVFGLQDGEDPHRWVTSGDPSIDVEELMIAGRAAVDALRDLYRDSPERAADVAAHEWSRMHAESMPALGEVRS